MTMLMVSTTGEHAAYYELDEALKPIEKQMPADLRLSVERIQENCEPALCTVLLMGGGGGRVGAAALRPCAGHRAFHGRGGGIVGGGRHRQPRSPDTIGQAGADARNQRRRAGVRLAGWRHPQHGGGLAVSGRRV